METRGDNVPRFGSARREANMSTLVRSMVSYRSTRAYRPNSTRRAATSGQLCCVGSIKNGSLRDSGERRRAPSRWFQQRCNTAGDFEKHQIIRKYKDR
jgi:hypothetical protein